MVWIVARDAYHIGASGIVYGLASFLLFSGLFRKDSRSIAISLVVIFLYGGMAYGLFPVNEEISWESHLIGSIGGLVAAFFYRKHATAVQEQLVESVPISDPPDTRYPSITYHHTSKDRGKRLQYFYKKQNFSEPDSENENLPGK